MHYQYLVTPHRSAAHRICLDRLCCTGAGGSARKHCTARRLIPSVAAHWLTVPRERLESAEVKVAAFDGVSLETAVLVTATSEGVAAVWYAEAARSGGVLAAATADCAARGFEIVLAGAAPRFAPQGPKVQPPAPGTF